MPPPAWGRGSPRRATSLLALLLVAIACTNATGSEPEPLDGPTSSPSATTVAPRPNIVMIVSDDQRHDSLRTMASVRRLLVERGTTFVNAFTTDPLCCPSRASILTGDYPHSTGVYRNSGRHGGWAAFRARAETSTIATWLQDAGYRTALIGKYFNGYRTTRTPPGWSRIMALISSGPAYFGYTLNEDGRAVEYGNQTNDYATDVFAHGAAEFIRSTPSEQPLFLYLAPSAPHLPALPAPRHTSGDVGRGPTWSPAVNEVDVSDKPQHIRSLDPVSLATMRKVAGRRARSLLAVDDAVAELVDALRSSGRLRDTLFVYTSDNGLALGEHRWRYKLTPYEESIRVPLVIRYDRLADQPGSIDRLALNIDLAPTLAEAAGIDVGGSVDGRSLLPLLTGHVSGWRRGFLIEHLETDRRGGSEPEVPTYCAVRTERWKFVRYATGEMELYDLETDAFELENLAGQATRHGLVTRFGRRLRELCDPPPPGFDT